MEYTTAITYADEGTLTTEFRPESGQVVIHMEVSGLRVRLLAGCDNSGVYGASIEDADIETALQRLAQIPQQTRLENLTGEPA